MNNGVASAEDDRISFCRFFPKLWTNPLGELDLCLSAGFSFQKERDADAMVTLRELAWT